jgi:hypothetical protein
VRSGTSGNSKDLTQISQIANDSRMMASQHFNFDLEPMNNLLTAGTKISLAILGSTMLWAEPGMIAALAQSKTSPFFQGITFPVFPGTVPQPASGNNPPPTPIYPLVEVPTPGLRTGQATGRSGRRNRAEPATDEQPVRRRRTRRPRRINPEG